MNPYLVLGVPPDADDQRIRAAYLANLKSATPETHRARFQAVTTAYEQIKDEHSRHKYELQNTETPGNSPLEAFLSHLALSPRPAPMSYEGMIEYLRLCSKT
jgi:curved DNA-binding protein CbpA